MRFKPVSLVVLAVFLVVVGSCSKDSSKKLSLQFVDDFTLPTEVLFQDSVIGGLSALWSENAGVLLYALSDDPGSPTQKGRENARRYDLRVKVENGKLGVEPSAVHFISSEGKRFPLGTLDPEAWILLPNGNFLFSSEHEANLVALRKKGETPPLSKPRLLEMTKQGAVIAEYALPNKFVPRDWSETWGLSPEQGIEGIAPSDAPGEIVMLAEGPLYQDRALGETNARMTFFNPIGKNLVPTKEFVYKLEPYATNLGFEPKVKDTGASDLLYVGKGRWLVIERSFYSDRAKQHRNVIRIFEVRVPSDATDVKNVDVLPASGIKSVEKRLILDFDDILTKLKPSSKPVNHLLDNVEGVTWGPMVDGKRTLLFVSDDNFNSAQRTYFALFKLDE